MCAITMCQEPDGRLLSEMANDGFTSSLANYGTAANVDARKPPTGATRWTAVLLFFLLAGVNSSHLGLI